MDEEVLFEEEDKAQDSDSIEVVVDQVETEKKHAKEVPLIDGQAIYDFEIDNMDEKPWEKPGADITDYFNYGFNEHTWKKYCAAQREFVKGGNTGSKKLREERTGRKGEDRHRRRERRTGAERLASKNQRSTSEKEERKYEERGSKPRSDDQRERARGKRDCGREKRYGRRR